MLPGPDRIRLKRLLPGPGRIQGKRSAVELCMEYEERIENEKAWKKSRYAGYGVDHGIDAVYRVCAE